MKGFKTELWVTPLSDGKTWKVVDHSFVYETFSGQDLNVPVGFVTDFASIPREFWDCYPPWGKYGRAAVLHDYLYTSQICTKEEADNIFLDAMLVEGVSTMTAELIYHAVKFFGGPTWEQHTKELAQTKI